MTCLTLVTVFLSKEFSYAIFSNDQVKKSKLFEEKQKKLFEQLASAAGVCHGASCIIVVLVFNLIIVYYCFRILLVDFALLSCYLLYILYSLFSSLYLDLLHLS